MLVHVYEVFLYLILIGKSSCIISLKHAAYLKYVKRGHSFRLIFMQKICYGFSVFSFHTRLQSILTCVYVLFILSRESVFHRVLLHGEELYRTFYLLHIRSDWERERVLAVKDHNVILCIVFLCCHFSHTIFLSKIWHRKRFSSPMICLIRIIIKKIIIKIIYENLSQMTFYSVL